MASRGTLQRDGQARSSLGVPNAPTGRRPPSAPRERKPALAALATLLIVGGALGAGYLVQNNDKRVWAIEVSSVIGVGQRIRAGALTEVQVAENTRLDFWQWSDLAQATSEYAKTTLYPGTLLTPRMATPSSGQAANYVEAELALKEGQYPVQLQVGNTVNVWADAASPAGCPGAISANGVNGANGTNGTSPLAQHATVLDITSPPEGGSGLDVEVAINPADEQSVACNSAAGNISIVIVPQSASTSSSTSSHSHSTTGHNSSTPSVTDSSRTPTGHHSSAPTPTKTASTKRT